MVIFLLFLYVAYCVEVNVMLPLNVVNNDGSIKDQSKLTKQLQKLRDEAHVDGIMSDVWWGVVQRDGIESYDWGAYETIVQIAQSFNLSVQFVMSFHKCGGNAGDDCNIPLPSFVLSEASQDIFYKDQQGHSDQEYISLGVDQVEVFSSKTALDLYTNYMTSFSNQFQSYLKDDIINKIEVGLGPCGEMRYPSYQLDRWTFPGIGEFQAFDSHMLKMLSDYATKTGHPSWTSPPTDAGTYDSRPQDTDFFTNGWKEDYGDYFLTWYSQLLLDHSDLILNEASKIFKTTNTKIAAKIAGIHWWHGYVVGAAECEAGYYHTSTRNGYDTIANVLKKYDAEFQFTCLEMTDQSQASCNCYSQPEELVELTKAAAKNAGISYSGENALQTYSESGFNQMLKMANGLDAITYLRLTDELFEGSNWTNFENFVNSAHNIQ